MTFEEITNLTIESTYVILLDRILDLSPVPNGEQFVSLHENEELDFYDRILLHPSLVKPSLQVLQAELASYKSELEAIEQARLDEIARVEGLTNRFNALVDVRGAITKAGLEIPNPAIELKRIITEDDTERLSLLESMDAAFQAEDVPKQQRKRLAQGLLALINGLVQIVIEHNLANGLTSAQKDQQKADNAELFQHLQDYRPAKFKQAVDAVVPDGVLVTQDMKDELLAFLAANGIT
jgi:hypothetical protein